MDLWWRCLFIVLPCSVLKSPRCIEAPWSPGA
ncbi:hypothetical protein CsSME_00050820 [Camellia sinensis var. sinensis]